MNGILGDLAGSVFDPIGKALWQGTLILLRAALSLVGKLGRVDPTPGAGVISGSLWSSMLGLAAIVAALLFFVQLTMAILAPRRNMLQTITGPLQYAIATALSSAVVLALLGAADGLTEGILATAGFDGGDFAGQIAGLGLADDVDGVKGMVLGVMGVVGILPLSIGYGITLLFRSAAIIVVFATLPILSAGLVSLATKHWFHRGARWMLALIFLKPTFALCFAIGSGVVKTAGQGPEPGTPGGTAAAAAGGPQTGVVTLLLGLGIMFIALFAPFALFRLFAFVEPGTQPHQTMMSAFGSAVAGFKQAGQGIASADVGSVFSSATGGRFGGGAAGTSSPTGGPDGTSPSGGGSGSGNGEEKKQLAATAALAAATGGTGAAAGAGAGAGAAGTGGAAAAGESAVGAGGAPGSLTNAAAGSGQVQGQTQDQEQGDGQLAGAGAASSGQLPGGAAASGAGGAGGASGSSGAVSGTSSGGGGASSGARSSGGYPAGSLAGVASSAASSVGGAVGSWGGGAVGAAGSAARSVGGGAWGASQGIAGVGPMPPAPQGGVVGTVGDYGPSDYSGGGFPSGGSPPNPYRDSSYDRPNDDGDDGDGGRDHNPDDRGRMSGVL